MKEFSCVITDADGIHARPAGKLVSLAKSFAPADVMICKDGRCGRASRIFEVMGLGVKKGDLVTFTVEGENEEDAADAIRKFMAENL
jgi:phosphocarrier protein